MKVEKNCLKIGKNRNLGEIYEKIGIFQKIGKNRTLDTL